MAHVVGSEGQVVIEQAFREQLGVEPGWTTVQRLVDGHVEVYFQPPAHDTPLAGSLGSLTNVVIAPGDAWQEARDTAWEQHLTERYGGASNPAGRG